MFDAMRSRKPGLALSLVCVLGGAACSSSSSNNGDDDGDDDVDDDGGRPGRDGGIITTPDAAFECQSTDLGGVTFDKIAVWRDDAKAAYSMIHDDMCGPGLEGIQELAAPALSARGLRAGLAPFVQACEEGGLWDMVREVEAAGHEIINHSYTHPEITPENAAHEVAEAKAAFDGKIANPISFYIFPYDFFTDATIAAVGSSGHLGARAGNRDDNDGNRNPPINTADATNDLRVEFDVWPRNYSKYPRYYPEDMLAVHVHNAVERGGWALREFHSVIEDTQSEVGHGFGPVKISDYEKHLDFLVTARRNNSVWTDTPSAVIRYRHARVACGASVNGTEIVYDTSNPDCVKFATPISVVVKTGSDMPGISATQGGTRVPVRKLAASTFSVTADPTKGSVALSGCANEGPAVEDIPLPARPVQAPTVCAIETVTGAGGAGKMDDLERPAEEFQVLPNPNQQDGRTGTWSWYPQLARVGQADEGGNTVLKYSGSNLAAWTGVTLAFLGGNGAGSCYDAGRYTGIKFRIKGTVAAVGELNNKVIVSLVTAKTQSQNYGGDLDGEGGHFNKVIPVTTSWTTVQIAWTELNRPTWGMTVSETAVAKDQLQAIDWGIADTATSFEIFIDDVELY